MEYWSPIIPIWQKIYSIIHFGLVLIFYHLLVVNHQTLSQITVSYCIAILLISITTIGFLLENRIFGLHLELLRCLTFLYFNQKFLPIISTVETDLKLSFDLIQITHKLFVYSFSISATICFLLILYRIRPYIQIIHKRFDKIQEKRRKLSIK